MPKHPRTPVSTGFRNAVFAVLTFMGALLPSKGAAQSSMLFERVSVRPCGIGTSAPCTPSAPRLYWDLGKLDTLVVVGRVVTRQVKQGATTVSYTDTLKAPVTRGGESEATWVPGDRANIYVDPDEKDKLHVNFWYLPIDSVPIPGRAKMPMDSAREIDYFYRLANREELRFPFRAVTVGATTIPFRVRPGYRAKNGERIDPDVATDANVNLYVGRTWGQARYTYLQNADENPIRQARVFTLGASIGLSSADVDSTTSRSADTPLGSKRSIGVISPGITGLVRIEGVDVGLFGGFDFGVGSGAGKWDYNRRPWIGLGLGFNLFKIGND